MNKFTAAKRAPGELSRRRKGRRDVTPGKTKRLVQTQVECAKRQPHYLPTTGPIRQQHFCKRSMHRRGAILQPDTESYALSTGLRDVIDLSPGPIKGYRWPFSFGFQECRLSISCTVSRLPVSVRARGDMDITIQSTIEAVIRTATSCSK